MAECKARHHTERRETDPGYTICGNVQTDPQGRLYWTGCLGRLRADLLELEQILPNLPDLLVTAPPSDHNDRRAARTDAPAPCRLDVLDLMDPRSDTPALALLQLWADNITEGRQFKTSPDEPAHQVRFMLTNLDWMARHDTADEAARDIHQARVWLDRRAGLNEPPMFLCPVVHPGAEGECGGPVYAQPAEFGVKCARCHSTWDGYERLAWLGKIAASG